MANFAGLGYHFLNMKRKMNPESLKNLKKIKKGTILNPEGGRAHDPAKKLLKRFTNSYLKEVIELAVMGNLAGLKAVAEDPDTPAIQVGVCTAMISAINKGDWGLLESIIVRIVGKVPDKIKVENADASIKIEFVDTDES